MSEILNCRAVALEKKAHFRKYIFQIFRNFRTPFPFSALSGCICSAVRQQPVECNLASNSDKRELHYIFVSDNFPKFSVQQFQNICDGVQQSPGLYTIVLLCIKKQLQQGQYLAIFRGGILATKSSVVESYFGSNQQYL